MNHHFPNVSFCGQMDPPHLEEEEDNVDKDLLVSWLWRTKKSMVLDVWRISSGHTTLGWKTTPLYYLRYTVEAGA